MSINHPPSLRKFLREGDSEGMRQYLQRLAEDDRSMDMTRAVRRGQKSSVSLPDGNVCIETHRDGETVDVQRVNNKVVTKGLYIMRDLLADVGRSPKFIALGTDLTATTVDMVALGQEHHRDRITRRWMSGTTLMLQLFVPEEDGNTYDYGEAGLFADSGWTVGQATVGGDMFARTVFTPVHKDASTSLTITWEIPVSSG